MLLKVVNLKATPNPLEKLDEEKLNYLKKIIGQLQNEFIDIVEKKKKFKPNHYLEKFQAGEYLQVNKHWT